jgi:isoleucyl-tRNA synthetase
VNYKDTLNLPQTDFSMKANLVKKEPAMLNQWNQMDLYQKLLDQNEVNPSFILHDGPPYANGHLHMGHALNKILKDIVVRYHFMKGFRVPYVPGWDCHGLPIEHQVLSKLKKKKEQKTTLEIRQICREYADEFVSLQREEFKRLGNLGRWNKPYLTMNYSYEAGIVRVFGKLAQKGLIEKGVKPIYWCGHCETALAEAEIEYAKHRSPSVYVQFSILSGHEAWLKDVSFKEACMLIWTTTPWTLPSNMAIAVNPNLDYVAVKVGDDVWVMAEKLVETILAKEGVTDSDVVARCQGSQLEGLCYEHPFMDRVEGLKGEREVILGDFVTAEDGTGCVHIAPGHGEDDYRVGQSYGLGVFMPVNAYARFTDQVPLFEGQQVFAANDGLIDLLREKGVLYHKKTIEHSYPHCWRCRKPVIFRATEQWFINVDKKDLRKKVLDSIDNVTWLPDWGQTRITEMVKNRPNWCISRQRSWGVPVPVAYCRECRYTHLDAEFIETVAQAVEKEGCDVWFIKQPHEIADGLICPKCGHQEFDKETDILDVWFDSGASHHAVLQQDKDLSFPADLYLEGSDQHRGWFQSSLFLSMGAEEVSPFKTILTHGFVVDGNGRKMSKSLGNVMPPQKIINQYGADLIRLFVASSDYSDDIRLSEDIVKQKVDAYRKMRNTCRYLLGNTFDFDYENEKISYDNLVEIDRWALSRLQDLIQKSTSYYDGFLFYKFYAELYHFCTVDMSSFYMDILKDRLYTAAPKSEDRLSAQTVMTEILLILTRMMAPILSFTSEEIWSHLPENIKPCESVHLSEWPQGHESWKNEILENSWSVIADVRDEVFKTIEPMRSTKEIGSSLEVGLVLTASGDQLKFLKQYQQDLAMIFIVSEVTLKEGSHLGIDVFKLDFPKCVRCWVYSESVGRDDEHSELCERCCNVVRSILLNKGSK